MLNVPFVRSPSPLLVTLRAGEVTGKRPRQLETFTYSQQHSQKQKSPSQEKDAMNIKLLKARPKSFQYLIMLQITNLVKIKLNSQVTYFTIISNIRSIKMGFKLLSFVVS